MKRHISLFLAIMMLACAFASCGTGTPAVTTEPPASVTTDGTTTVTDPPVTTIYPDIPEELDYEQYEFKIFVNVHSTEYSDFDLENAGYDVVNEAAFKRNTIVEETLSITITPDHVSGSAFSG
ncbi:MAG: hypothetical protein IJN63_09435, partial [Clostridia bacterium]|nr:hypothetical protein [Clostridia bacterium]